jgi:Arrestin (or S-antigen), N-terminal domain
LQERLIKKLGPNAFPFYFELPPHCPASVTLQPAPGDTGKPCGVDYELKAFVGETQDDKPHKRLVPKKSLFYFRRTHFCHFCFVFTFIVIIKMLAPLCRHDFFNPFSEQLKVAGGSCRGATSELIFRLVGGCLHDNLQ